MDPVPSKPLRVLAVDDCALDLRLLTALLDRAGAIPTDAGLAKAADDWGVRYVLVLERPFAPDRRTIDVEALRSAPGVRLVFRSGRAAVYQVRP